MFFLAFLWSTLLYVQHKTIQGKIKTHETRLCTKGQTKGKKRIISLTEKKLSDVAIKNLMTLYKGLYLIFFTIWCPSKPKVLIVYIPWFGPNCFMWNPIGYKYQFKKNVRNKNATKSVFIFNQVHLAANLKDKVFEHRVPGQHAHRFEGSTECYNWRTMGHIYSLVEKSKLLPM